MKKHTLMNRTATLAIAATVAFTPTPLLAQDAPAAEAPVESVTPTEPVTAEPTVAPEAVAAPAESATESTPAAPVAKPRAKVQAKASAPAARLAPARAEIAVAPQAPAPLEAQPLTPPLSAPIAEPTAETVAPTMAIPGDDLERAAFAGILALLALGGAATAVSRRRRAHAALDRPAAHEIAHSAPPTPMPVHREPVRHASSAFAWGRTPAAAAPIANAGGSWVERARRGPSAENPSLSLKKRLKRAAFYEQRERAVAAGRAQAIVPGAGLPERATENFRQSWTPQPKHTHAFQPA